MTAVPLSSAQFIGLLSNAEMLRECRMVAVTPTTSPRPATPAALHLITVRAVDGPTGSTAALVLIDPGATAGAGASGVPLSAVLSPTADLGCSDAPTGPAVSFARCMTRRWYCPATM